MTWFSAGPCEIRILGSCRGLGYPIVCSVMIRVIVIVSFMLVLSHRIDVALECLLVVVETKLADSSFSVCFCPCLEMIFLGVFRFGLLRSSWCLRMSLFLYMFCC